MAAATRKAGGPSAGGQGVVVLLRAAQTNFRKFPQAIRRSCTSPLGGEVHEGEEHERVSALSAPPPITPRACPAGGVSAVRAVFASDSPISARAVSPKGCTPRDIKFVFRNFRYPASATVKLTGPNGACARRRHRSSPPGRRR